MRVDVACVGAEALEQRQVVVEAQGALHRLEGAPRLRALGGVVLKHQIHLVRYVKAPELAMRVAL